MKKDNLFLRFSSIGIQMGLLIAGGAWLGQYLDNSQGNKTPGYTILFSLLGVAIGLYIVIKEVINLSNKD